MQKTAKTVLCALPARILVMRLSACGGNHGTLCADRHRDELPGDSGIPETEWDYGKKLVFAADRSALRSQEAQRKMSRLTGFETAHSYLYRLHVGANCGKQGRAHSA